MADEQLYTPDADNQVFGDPGKPGNLQSLYDKLHGADLYTKSFDEFKKKYSDTQNIDALYNKLNSAEYFQKSKDDFYQKYFPDQHIERKVDQHFNIADARAQMLAKTQPLPGAPTASAPPVTPDNTPMEPGSPFPKAYQNNIVYPDQNKLIGEIDAAKKTITEKLNDQKALNQFIRGQQTSQIQNIRHMAEDGQITPEQANQQIYRLDVNKDYADKKQSIVNNMRPYLHSADDPKIKKAMYVLDAANRLKNDPNSGQKAAKVLANAKQIENGDLDLTPTGRLVQPLGFWDSLLHGWNQKNKAFDDYDFFSTKPDKEVIEELEKRRKEYDAETPIKMPQGAGVISSTIGAMPIKSLVAEGITAAIPGAEELAPAVGAAVGSGDFYRMSKATAIPDIYNDLRGKGVAPEQALSQAREVATKQALIDAAQGAVTAGIGGRLGRASKNAALSFSDVMGSRALEVAGVAGSAGSAQALKNAIAGRDTDSGTGEAMATQAGMAAAIGAAVLVGKGIQVKASRPLLYHVTKDIPPEALQGHIDEMLTNGQITTDQANTAKVAIDKQYQDNAKIPASVPEEKVPAIQEKIEQRDNLKKLLDNSHESFHPAIKAQIAALDADIVAQAMGQPSPSLLDKAKTEIQKGNTKGFTKSILEHSADDPDALRGILKEIAEQAHDPRSAATTEDTYGKPLVDIAKELHPIENFPKQEALLTHPEPADQSGVDQTAPSASVNQGPLESRHANTPNDDAGKISGTTAETLSKEGEQEAQKLAADAKEKAVNKTITSDLNRNQQTAQIVSGQTGATIETNPNLRTWDIGEFDSMPDEEFKRVKAWFVTHPDKKEYDGQRVNESFNQYKDRIIAAQLALENEPPTTLVINNSNNMGVWDAYIKNGRQWNEQAAKDYLTAKKPEPATLTTKITSDATTEQKTNEMDVRQQTGDGETMGSGDARPSESARSSTSGPNDTGPREKNKNTGQEGEGGVIPPDGKGSGAAPSSGNDFSSIKNSYTIKAIEQRGLSPLLEEATRSHPEVWEEARRLFDNGYDTQALIDKLKANPKYIPTDTENALTLIHQIGKEAELDAINEHIPQAYDQNDAGLAAELTARRAALKDDLQDIYNVNKASGREAARSLSSRAIMADRKYSLVAMENDLRAAQGGRPLTEDQIADVQKKYEAIRNTNKELEDYISNLKQENTDLKQRLDKAAKLEAKSSRIKQSKEEIKTSIKGSFDQLRKIARDQGLSVNPIPVEMLPHLFKISKDLIRLGYNSAESIINKIHTELNGSIKDLKPEHVQEALDQAYIDNELAKLKERLRNSTDKTIQNLSSLKEGKVELAAPKFGKGLFLDDKAIKLMAGNERAKRAFDQAVREEELKHRSLAAKGADIFVKWERAFKLSYITTLAKLGSAAGTRLILSPAEEVVGGVYSKILPTVARAATSEGGLNIKAEAKALSSAFTKGIIDAGKQLTSGTSDIDLVFGKAFKESPEMVNFFGQVHSAIKAPVKRAAFERSLEKQFTTNIRNGVDVYDPMVMAKMGARAYKQANRAIFMQDNFVSDSYRKFVNLLENSKDYPQSGKMAASALNWLIPFVKVPTNIIGETGSYAGGVPYAAGKLLYHAFNKSMGAISEDEADMIMRNLKKGSIGAAAMLAGYFNPENFGGYYQEREKRKAGDVKAMKIRLFGTDIPSYLAHHPLFEAMQIGATIRRVQDKKVHGAFKGLGAGLMAAGLGLTEHEPLVDAPMRLLTAIKSESDRKKYMMDLAKSTLVPGLVQNIAEWTDPAGARKPDNVIQSIESGIPGLRENVPEKPIKGASGGAGATGRYRPQNK